MFESTPDRIAVTAPVNYRIVRAVLTAKQPFLQSELAEAAAARASQVSRLVRWLVEHHHVLRRRFDGRYVVTQPAGLVLALFPYQRVMSKALAGTAKVRGGAGEAVRALGRSGATLCLESALAQYSDYFRSGRVAVYHPEPAKLLSQLTVDEGGALPVEVYGIDLPLEGDQAGPDREGTVRRTTRFRTLVDLVCDDRTYVAKDLFADLWGVRLD